MCAAKLKPGQFEAFTKFNPVLSSGTYTLNINQEIMGPEGSPIHIEIKPDPIYFELPSMDIRLTDEDVLSTYPARGARDVPTNHLCHIALKRKTLPWERDVDPSVALLVLADGEATFVHGTGGLPDHIKLAKDSPAWKGLKGMTQADFGLLCHGRRMSLDDKMVAGDDDGKFAVVLSNRLPQKDLKHRACLVGLTGGTFLSNDGQELKTSSLPRTEPKEINLHVLYSWTFTAGTGGDFQSVLQATDQHEFGYYKEAEICRHNDSPKLLAADEKGIHRYGGPLVAGARKRRSHIARSARELEQIIPDGNRADQTVSTYSAAFELGRLMALAHPTVLPALIQLRRQLFEERMIAAIGENANNPPRTSVQSKSSKVKVSQTTSQSGLNETLPAPPTYESPVVRCDDSDARLLDALQEHFGILETAALESTRGGGR